MYDIEAGKAVWTKKINYNTNYIQQYAGMMIFTSAGKSFYIDPQTGNNEWEVENTILFVDPDYDIGIGYHNTKKNLLQGIDLKSGDVVWKRQINREYGWNDLRYLNDSVILLAAAGLHTINLKDGSGWSYDAVTGEKDYQSTAAANGVGIALGVLTGTFVTRTGYDLVRDLVSNILIENDFIYFADADKINCLGMDGTVKWTHQFTKNSLSKSELFSIGDTLYMINKGFAYMGVRKLRYGASFVAAIDKKMGKSIFITDAGDKNVYILASQCDYKSIYTLLPSNQVIRNSVFDGSVKERKLFDTEKYGTLEHFINSRTCEKTDTGFKSLVINNPDKIHICNSDTLFEFDDKLNFEREIKIAELYVRYLNIEKYRFLSYKNETIVIDDKEKEIARFEMTGGAFKIGRKLYEVQNKILTELDISEFY